MKEATMNQNLINLRQRVMEASMELIRAQRAYLDAAGKSESELKEAAEDYLKATGPYDDALQELRQFLLAAEPSEVIAVELEHTERLIEALDKEKQVGSKLIERRSLGLGQNEILLRRLGLLRSFSEHRR